MRGGRVCALREWQGQPMYLLDALMRASALQSFCSTHDPLAHLRARRRRLRDDGTHEIVRCLALQLLTSLVHGLRPVRERLRRDDGSRRGQKKTRRTTERVEDDDVPYATR